MSGMRSAWRTPALAIALLTVASALVSGCVGPTTVTEESAGSQYDVAALMDPPALNPPALGSLTFTVRDAKTGKTVTQFEPVFDGLMHTVTIRRDLQFFRHSFTDRLLRGAATVPVSFPTSSLYNIWTYYQPAKQKTQVYKMTVQAGGEGAEPELVEDWRRTKISYGLGVQLLHTGEWQSKQPTQLLFRVTERGYPVRSLSPYLGEPGHLWIVDAGEASAGEGGRPALDHLSGASEAHVLKPGVIPVEGSAQTQPGGFPSSGDISGSDQKMSAPNATLPPPTLMPQAANALASVTAKPVATLLPVQQTPQSSVLGTPAVPPAIGYGPEVAFTYTFPHPGFYKMWLELGYSGQVILTDFTLDVK